MAERFTIELDHVEHDLLLCALTHWRGRLVPGSAGGPAHLVAGEFTVRRINELEARLLDAPAAGVKGPDHG